MCKFSASITVTGPFQGRKRKISTVALDSTGRTASMSVNYFTTFAEQVLNAEDTGMFAFTDYGNAERLVDRFGNDFRFCPPRAKWLLWNGNYWQWDETNIIEQFAKKTVRGIFQEAIHADSDRVKDIGKHAVRSENAARIRAMIDLAKSEPGIPILPNELDKDPWLLNVKNGTLDLRVRRLTATAQRRLDNQNY